jgi:Protein of unknown function (DUF3800)
MLVLYCDDSGTHDQSEWAIAASLIAPDYQWEKFTEEWQAVAGKEGFKEFHMSTFVAKKPPFDTPEWADDEKRRRTIRQLLGIIKCRVRIAFASAVQKAAYDEVVPAQFKEDRAMGLNHYTFAVRMCMGRIINWRSQYGHRGRLQYVFDRVSKGRGEIDTVFNRSLAENPAGALADSGIVRGGWSFENKAEFIPIQAADILAWEALHHMRNFSTHGDQFVPRKSYVELTKVPGMFKYYDRDSLGRLVEGIRDRLGVR